MTFYALTAKSKNAKTGPIPVSTTSFNTCPDACSLKGNGCYAESGPMAIHWRAVNSGERGTDLTGFLKLVRAFPEDTMWRHNQAGDLPGTGDSINARELRSLIAANRGRRGFTYTHKPLTEHNSALIREANANGFTINVSCDTLQAADIAKANGAGPVAVVLPSTTVGNLKTPAGHSVVICPAMTHDNVTCQSCKLCAISNRAAIIGFPAHGARRFNVNSLIRISQTQ